MPKSPACARRYWGAARTGNLCGCAPHAPKSQPKRKPRRKEKRHA